MEEVVVTRYWMLMIMVLMLVYAGFALWWGVIKKRPQATE
jgi:hypothetical protein